MADLITIGQVRQFLQKNAPDTNQDAEIGALITQYSRLIERYCDREFTDSGDGAVRTFEVELGFDGGFVSLSPYDAQAVSQVQIDTDQATAVTLSSNEWRLWPRPNRNGVFQAIRIVPLSRSLGPINYRNVQVKVTGTWGFATVPADVQMACKVAVGIALRRDVAAFSTVFKLDEGNIDRPEALPSSVRSMLDPYCRMLIS